MDENAVVMQAMTLGSSLKFSIYAIHIMTVSFSIHDETTMFLKRKLCLKN